MTSNLTEDGFKLLRVITIFFHFFLITTAIQPKCWGSGESQDLYEIQIVLKTTDIRSRISDFWDRDIQAWRTLYHLNEKNISPFERLSINALIADDNCLSARFSQDPGKAKAQFCRRLAYYFRSLDPQKEPGQNLRLIEQNIERGTAILGKMIQNRYEDLIHILPSFFGLQKLGPKELFILRCFLASRIDLNERTARTDIFTYLRLIDLHSQVQSLNKSRQLRTEGLPHPNRAPEERVGPLGEIISFLSDWESEQTIVHAHLEATLRAFNQALNESDPMPRLTTQSPHLPWTGSMQTQMDELIELKDRLSQGRETLRGIVGFRYQTAISWIVPEVKRLKYQDSSEKWQESRKLESMTESDYNNLLALSAGGSETQAIFKSQILAYLIYMTGSALVGESTLPSDLALLIESGQQKLELLGLSYAPPTIEPDLNFTFN